MTPGVKWKVEDIEHAKPLDEERTARIRALAARANYLALDRLDIAFASKECCRRMVQPRSIDWLALKRVAGYLAHRPRVAYRFEWQTVSDITAYVDTDFAGCLETRRSTSGGCLMMGQHLLKHWSTTQKVLALSSGEAELYGVVKEASEALGLQSVASDLGIQVNLLTRAPRLAFATGTGIGEVRHLATGQLWVQERIRSGAFRLFKLPGVDNPGDVCTKHVPSELIIKHLGITHLQAEAGRPSCAPQITEKQGAAQNRSLTGSGELSTNAGLPGVSEAFRSRASLGLVPRRGPRVKPCTLIPKATLVILPQRRGIFGK